MDDMSLVYNINLCRLCQVPGNLDLVQTDSPTEAGETYLDLLKFIFNDVFWIEDKLISLACKACLKKLTDIAKFKRLCLETNGRRGALIFDPVKVEVITIKLEEDQAVTEQADDGPEVETATKRVSGKTKSKTKYFPSGKPIGRPRKPIHEGYNKFIYRCDICPEVYNTEDKLIRHIFKHTGIKNYICTVCGKKFVGKSDLRNHELLHDKDLELKYACDMCPKKFKGVSHLRTHKIVVHTDKKDYKYLCTECGRKFALSCWLKEHILRHTNTRNFACDLCDKSFHTKPGLRRHATSHSNVRAYKCDLCPAEYKRCEVLTRHKTKVHGIENINGRLKTMEKIC